MCGSYVENFFYPCGHINIIELPSLNPNCRRRAEVKRWDARKCPRCLGVRGGWAQITLESYPCQGIKGEIDQTYPLEGQPLWQKYTEREIWKTREDFLKYVREDCALRRRENEKLVYWGESVKGVSPIEMAYFVDSTEGEAYNPIVKRVLKPEVHDETCAICKGSLGGDGDEACDGKGVALRACLRLRLHQRADL